VESVRSAYKLFMTGHHQGSFRSDNGDKLGALNTLGAN
jgi:hypothetical protein